MCINVTTTASISNSCNVWHMRFGHPSHEKLVQIHKDFPFVKCMPNVSCGVCFYAKQKRLPFPDSNSVSMNCFDLVHMYIWAPLSIPSMFGHQYFFDSCG